MRVPLLALGHWTLCILTAALAAGTLFWGSMALQFADPKSSVWGTLQDTLQLVIMSLPISLCASLFGAAAVVVARTWRFDTMGAYIIIGVALGIGTAIFGYWMLGAAQLPSLPRYGIGCLVAGIGAAWVFRMMLTGQFGWKAESEE